MKKRILVADGHEAMASRLCAVLQRRGFEALRAGSVPLIFERMASSGPFDLLVLGQEIHGIAGQNLADTLKVAERGAKTQLLLLPNNSGSSSDPLWDEIKRARDTADQIETLFGGASSAPYPLKVGPLIVDPENHQVTLNGKFLALTTQEIQLMYLFADHVGELLTTDELFETVWGHDSTVKKQIVAVYVKRLRAKCARSKEIMFRTLSKVGYQFLLLKS
jgi:DNA-binding response OmpR family regulator